MVRRKPKPKADPDGDDDDDRHSLTVDGRNLKVSVDTAGRGIILVYAIAFSIVVLSLGFVAYQIITALKVSGGVIRESIGLALCLLTTFMFAFLSR